MQKQRNTICALKEFIATGERKHKPLTVIQGRMKVFERRGKVESVRFN